MMVLKPYKSILIPSEWLILMARPQVTTSPAAQHPRSRRHPVQAPRVARRPLRARRWEAPGEIRSWGAGAWGPGGKGSFKEPWDPRSQTSSPSWTILIIPQHQLKRQPGPSLSKQFKDMTQAMAPQSSPSPHLKCWRCEEGPVALRKKICFAGEHPTVCGLTG